MKLRVCVRERERESECSLGECLVRNQTGDGWPPTGGLKLLGPGRPHTVFNKDPSKRHRDSGTLYHFLFRVFAAALLLRRVTIHVISIQSCSAGVGARWSLETGSVI